MTSPLTEKELCLLGLCVVALSKKRGKTRRKQWTKKWLLQRDRLTHTALLDELRLEPGSWFNNLRMDEVTYRRLLSLVTPMIEKRDTCMRRAITPHERLSATLRFLATGQSYEEMKFSVAISAQALSRIIPETCLAIWNALHKEYMKFPDEEDDWKEIADEFYEKWNFPNCMGAVAGKHVAINPPAGGGSYFFNKKLSHSLVLMVIVNARYEFIMCDFGTNRSTSDGEVLANTTFYERLCNNNLKIPPDTNPKNSIAALPYVFVGSEAFSLRRDFMKPYSSGELTHDRRIFNCRLSRACRIIENVFCIMSSRFRIFSKPINLSLEKIDVVGKTCCILHNYLRRSCGDLYISSDQFETVGDKVSSTTDSSFISLDRVHNSHSSEQAKEAREMFLKYFTGEGAVPLQETVMC